VKIDLHTHSTFSDGTAAPAEIVDRAEKAGVTMLALSDHDSVSGVGEAMAAASGRNVTMYSGIELNTRYGDSVHILGYGVRWQDQVFLERLAEFRQRRVVRVKRILEHLRRLGIELPYEEVQGVSSESMGRAHVADALRRRGVVPNRAEAFRRFLSPGRPAYVGSLGPEPGEAISLIRAAGGFAVLAHPGTVPEPDVVADWARAGLEGIEVHYGSHAPSDIVRFQDLADRLGLLATGGSDYHGRGSGREGALGVEVPDEVGRRFLDRVARCA